MANKKYTDVSSGTAYTDSVILVAHPTTGALSRVTVAALLAASGTTPGGGGGATPLSTPTLTATVISSTQIDLSWTNVANESSYMLEWSPNGSSGWTQIGGTIAANTTTYSHTGLTASTLYYYRVKAVGDGVTYTDSGYGTDSDTTSAPGATQLATPASFTATATGPTTINLVWGDVSNESNYLIQRSPVGAGTWSTINSPAANATSYGDTGLTAATGYDYRMKAVGDGVTYLDSNWATSSATTSAGSEAVVWTSLNNATDDGGGGVTVTSSAATSGARATKKLTGSSWSVIVQLKADMADSALLYMFLKTVNPTSYNHNEVSNDNIVGGFTTNAGDIARCDGPTTELTYNVAIGTGIIANGMYILMEKSGNNLTYYTSPDGSAYTLRGTDTGALTGVTDVYIFVSNGSAVAGKGFAAVTATGLVNI